MWGSKLKKRKAVDNWHTKAMLVDPKKTKITMLWAAEPETCEVGEDLKAEASVPGVEELPIVTEAFKANVAVESLGTRDQQLGSAGNLEPVEPSPETLESPVAETPSASEPAENLEVERLNLETLESDVAEAQSTVDFAGGFDVALSDVDDVELGSSDLGLGLAETPCSGESDGTLEMPISDLQSGVSNLAESEKPCEPTETSVAVEQKVPEASLEAASPESLKAPEAIEHEAADTLEVDDSVYDVVFEGKEPVNMQFLRALENTRSMWDSDEKLTKIVQKLKKGKNLKRKEFERVYLHIHTYCRYH